MIENIHIQNFKSLKDVSFKPMNLNLLMGLNGMGKTSFIQSLLLLRQNKDSELSRFKLNGDYTEIGKGKDALYQDST
jgi:AAA15 family ATPase/GTPase